MSDPVALNSASLSKQVLAHSDMFDRLAERRFGPGVLAEEAALYVLNALEKDDWRRVRAYAAVRLSRDISPPWRAGCLRTLPAGVLDVNALPPG